jgi:hypothetical protein
MERVRVRGAKDSEARSCDRRKNRYGPLNRSVKKIFRIN